MRVYGKSRGLKAMKNSASVLDVQIRGMRSLGEKRLDRGSLERYIQNAMRVMIKEALMRSLLASGVKINQGEKRPHFLEKAVKNPVIQLGKNVLRISFSSTLPQKVLTYASAVNYGAVRNSGGLGKRAKKTLKTAVFKDRALSERELRGFTKGVNQVHDGRVMKRGSFKGMTEGDARKLLQGKLGKKMKIGGASIIKPKPFFFLSAADKKAIAAKFQELYDQYMAGTLQRPKAGK